MHQHEPVIGADCPPAAEPVIGADCPPAAEPVGGVDCAPAAGEKERERERERGRGGQCGKLAVAKSPWRVKRPIRRLVFSSQSPNGRSLLPRRSTARDRGRAREKWAGARAGSGSIALRVCVWLSENNVPR